MFLILLYKTASGGTRIVYFGELSLTALHLEKCLSTHLFDLLSLSTGTCPRNIT